MLPNKFIMLLDAPTSFVIGYRSPSLIFGSENSRLVCIVKHCLVVCPEHMFGLGRE